MGFAVAFLAGVIGTLVLPALPSIVTAVALGISTLALGLAFSFGLPFRKVERTRARASYRRDIGSVVCGVAVGFLVAWIEAHSYLADRWRTNERVITDVIVDTVPVLGGDTTSFDAITDTG